MYLKWDPNKSNLLDEIVDELVTKIMAGEVNTELRPRTLVQLGGNFEKLYHAAFIRTERPKWAVKRYPPSDQDDSGFNAFILEIQERIGNQTTVVNAKKYVKPYDILPRSKLKEILIMRSVYLQGDISREEALESLQKEHGIQLKSGGVKYYFPNLNKNGKNDDLAQISTILDNLNPTNDHSDIDCIKGLLFEGLVGTYLAYKQGGKSVRRQVSVPILYTDLSGVSHREVYLDFLVDSEIIETKWQNNLENILESILPQREGLFNLNGEVPNVTVICRHKDPEINALYLEHYIPHDETEIMGLNAPISRLQNLFVYKTLVEYMDKEAPQIFQSLLEVMDNAVQTFPTAQLKSYVTALRYIATNGKNILEQLSKLQKYIQLQQVVSAQECEDQFGPIPHVEEENRNVILRQRIIDHAKIRSRQKDYLTLYNLLFNEDEEYLTAKHKERLSSVPSDEIENAWQQILRQREESYQERLQRKLERRGKSIDDLVELQQRAFRRLYVDQLRNYKILRSVIQHESAALDRTSDELLSRKEMVDSTVIHNFEKHYLQFFDILKRNNITSIDTPEMINSFKRVRAVIEHAQDFYQTWNNKMKSLITLEVETGTDGWVTLDRLNHHVVELESEIRRVELNLSTEPYYIGAQKIALLTRQKKIKLTPFWRKIVQSEFSSEGVLNWNYLLDSHKLALKAATMMSTFTSELTAIGFVARYYQRNNYFQNARAYPVQELHKSVTAHLEPLIFLYEHATKVRGKTINKIDDIIHGDFGIVDYIKIECQQLDEQPDPNKVASWKPKTLVEFMSDYSVMFTKLIQVLQEITTADMNMFYTFTDTYEGIEREALLLDAVCSALWEVKIEKRLKGGSSVCTIDMLIDEPKELIEYSNSHNIIGYRLFQDYTCRKISNAKLIAQKNPLQAIQYLTENIVDPNLGALPLKSFAEALKDTLTVDNETFRHYMETANN